METAGQVLRRRARGFFITVHLEDEAFGEVSIDFHREFQAELGPFWTLYDSKGSSHQIAFNRDPRSPRLTHGWMNLRKFYQLTGDHVIYLTYLGDSLFRLHVFEEEALPHQYPWYNTKSLMGRAVYFEVIVSHEAATGNYLALKNEFAKFVKKFGYESLFLCGPSTTVKLGNGWASFFDQNRFRKGNRLRFQFLSVL